MQKHSTLPPLCVLLAAGMPFSLSAASTITAIDILPGKASCTVSGISGDGQIVVGTATDSLGVNGEAFSWTAAGGLTGLGFLPGGSSSVARAISKDGSTIVGDATSSYSKPIGGTEAFRYRDGVMTGLHGSTQLIMSQGWAVNADGTVITDSNGNRRWTAAGGVDQNATLYSGFGVSDDGTVIVGRSSGFVAQRWTAATGAVDLPNTTAPGSTANAVSGDGQVAVGNRNNVACYWSQSAGFVSIGKVGVISSALAVNHDGTLIVGRANTAAGGNTEAFIWTPAGGMQSLTALLTAQKVDLSAWLYKRVATLVEATGVSADGQYVIGNGTKQGFIVKLDLNNAPPTQSPLEQWRQSQFGSSQNSGNAADAADPDGDGWPNLLEYALGASPSAASSTPALDVRAVADALVAGFNRISDPNLKYAVEAATSLTLRDWAGIWSSTGTNNVAGHVDVPDVVKLSTQASRFLRLKVSY